MELRKKNVFVLEKGDIEDYYPDDVDGSDKPSKAQSFCSKVNTKEIGLSLCNNIVDGNGRARNEFEVIFGTIFET